MPQQRRALETRRAIVVAAAEEFDRSGYDATPLSAILRRSGVTKGAFYFHFSSKEALARALVRFQSQSWSRLWQRWAHRDLDPLSIAVGMIGEAARALETDVVLRAGTRLGGRSPLREAIENPGVPDWEGWLTELLRRAADRGDLRPGVDPDALARVLHAALRGVREIASGEEMSARATEVWRVLLGSVASPEWLRRNSMKPAFGSRPTS